MSNTRDQIQQDFDRLAALPETWNHNNHYHAFLLRHLPRHCNRALDIGCGTGTFARLLAERAQQVYALDLSPVMLQRAQAQSHQHPNIYYQLGDLATWSFPDGCFDCIASIATLHHVPLAAALTQLRAALRPGGVLLVLDLYQGNTLQDVLWSTVAAPVSTLLRLWHNHYVHEPQAVRDAWSAHGAHDVYLTLNTVHRICAELLPGTRVRRHLLWRYSLVWRKPK